VGGDWGPADQLVTAAAQGDGAAVARLLAAGADPNALVSGRNASRKLVHSTALGAAAALGRVEAARLLLEGGADPSRASCIGVTPLMAAAGKGQLEVLRLLLARGVALDAVFSGTGGTAFHCACQNNEAECAEALARAGCDVGLKDNDGQTGREVAEGMGHAAVVARLRAVVAEQLRAAQAAGPTPAPEAAVMVGDGGPAVQLVNAACKGDGAAVARLLAAGADPNASVTGRDASGNVIPTTALGAAAALGRVEVARLLLEGGADPSRAAGDGATTPLMAAALDGQLKVLRLLLARGAAVDAVDPHGWTAFHCACDNNQAESAEALVKAGCDVGIKIKSGATGREMAEARGHAAVVARLRAVVGEQLRAAQAAGPAPAPKAAAVVGDGGPAVQLVTAACKGDAAAVARLLAAGADPNASMAERGASGKMVRATALCVAAAHSQPEVARLLLDAGADPSRAGGIGATPLMVAANCGQLEVLRLLLARGAAVDAVDPEGWTAFHCACDMNQLECAEALARAGCDVGIKTHNGATGGERAEARGHAAVLARLRAVEAERPRAAQTAAGSSEPEPVPSAEALGLLDALALDSSAAAGRRDAVAAVARLLAAGADPNASVPGRRPSGEVFLSTPLYMAAGHGRLEAARLLLDAGADPSLAGSDGATTPLMAAAGKGQLEMLRLLLGRGAAVDAVDPATSHTAFHFACVTNQADCAEELVRAGCDVGLKDNDGQTGWEMAEARGSKEVARRLRALARLPFVGVLVELAGLVGAAEHNGKRATVMGARPSCPIVPRARACCLHFAQSSMNAMHSIQLAVVFTPPLPPPPRGIKPGAALPAGEAALHAGAVGAAGRGRRRGEAHGRAAGELCAAAPAGRHAVRPGQEVPLALTAAVRCCSLPRQPH
jgi:ankyrin repeat protein